MTILFWSLAVVGALALLLGAAVVTHDTYVAWRNRLVADATAEASEHYRKNYGSSESNPCYWGAQTGGSRNASAADLENLEKRVDALSPKNKSEKPKKKETK